MAVQFIKRSRAGMPVTWYVYAYKGGPQIMKHVGSRRPVLSAAAVRKLAEALERRDAPKADEKFRTIIRAWRASPEWQQLAPSTKKVWQRHVDLIEDRWGDAPRAVWNDPRMKSKVVEWRNSRRESPRTADIGITVLVTLLKWAVLNGQGIAINVATEIPRLYKGGHRQEILWSSEDIRRFTQRAAEEGKPWIADGLRLAALTGLRLADLVTLTFDHVTEHTISKVAMKTSRSTRRRVTIPITKELELLLAELQHRERKPGVRTVLVNGHGYSWSSSGFGGSFNRIRDLANIVHVDEDGTIRTKHLHDVRGTFCTMLLVDCELTDEQAAEIMGWSKDRVSGIRKVYVDGNRVAMALAQRIGAKQKAKQATNSDLSG